MGQGASRGADGGSADRSAGRRSAASRLYPWNLRPRNQLPDDSPRRLRLRPSLSRQQRQHDGEDPPQHNAHSTLGRRTRLSRQRLSGFFTHSAAEVEHGQNTSNALLYATLGRGESQQQQQQQQQQQHLQQQPDTRTPSPTTPLPSLPLDVPPSNIASLPPPETPRLRPQRSPHSIADRISSLTPDRGFRSMTASLRRRRSPLRTSDDPAAALTRLLSLAAQATAASLLGRSADSAMADLQSPNGVIEGDDGTFNGFLQALQSGRFAAALNQEDRSSPDDNEDGDESPRSFEFFRMFRFGTSNTPRPRNADSSRPSSIHSAGQADEQPTEPESIGVDEDGEHRMVPILIVGVRALSEADEGFYGSDGSVPSFFDALTGAPTTVGLGLSDNPASDSLLPLPRETSRRTSRRRASIGGFNLFSHGRESSRQARPSELGQQGGSAVHSAPPLETPPGPHPPPTTPSSPGLSAFSSGTSTPTRRSSLSTAGSLNTSSRRNSLIRRMAGSTLEPTAEESASQPRFSRRRRDSEPDTQHFGAGSSRRNGVLVEPDDLPTEGHRSWIIYILGGSYPENHPILTTPSLFTDSPTYEDMVLLSSLLGPAKPPVANAEDVASAGGLFKIRMVDGAPVAVEEGGGERLAMSPSAQCLVCLSGYQADEEARRLVQCQHLFHRECIDQWLTTGRNSCPLCRGQGVDDKGSETAISTSPEAGGATQAVV